MALLRGQGTIVDENGDVIPNAIVTVRSETSGALASLFDDRDGTNSIGNPINADSNGYVFFYVEPGRYRITASDGVAEIDWRDVVLPEGPLGSSGLGEGSDLVTYTRTGESVTDALDKRAIRVSTVSDLKALTNLIDGQEISLAAWRSGWAATVDGPKGGGSFVVDISDTTTAEDGGTVFVTSGGVRVKRKDYTELTFEMFGAYGDGTNIDTTFIQSAIDSRAAERFPIIADSSVYLVDASIAGRSGISIYGAAPTETIIKADSTYTGGGAILSFNAVDSFITGVTLQDFRIDCNGQDAHGLEIVRAYDANRVTNVMSLNTADARSSFRFVGLTDAGPVDIGQTLVCSQLYGGHLNATATSPTIFLERLQESVFIECKAWGFFGGSKAPANPWVLQDCRSVTLIQPSATSTTGYGIRILSSTKDVTGISIVSPLYENVDNLLETLDSGGFSIIGLNHAAPRFQSPIDANAQFLLQDCNSCYFDTLSQKVTIGATCVATKIDTVDSTQITNGSNSSTIVQRANSVNLRQKIIAEGGISVFNSDESVEMLRTSEPASGVVGVLLAVNRSGTTTLDTVTIGSPDSGGAGFRVLRVAN